MQRHLAMTLLGLCLLAVFTPTLGGSLSPFEPVLDGTQDPQLRGETWFADTATHLIELTPLTAEMRLAYFERVTGQPTDPFADRDGEARYISFLLRIENRGKSQLIFNPLRSWLVTESRQIEAPVSGTDLKFDHRSSGREFPVAYQNAVELLFDDVQTLDPGKAVHGLLLYPALEPRVRRFKLDINVEIAGGGSSELVAAYQWVKPKKKRRQKE